MGHPSPDFAAEDGDHGFGVPDAGLAQNEAKIARAVDAVVSWVRPIVAR